MTLPNTQNTLTAASDVKPSRRGFFVGAAAASVGVVGLTTLNTAPVDNAVAMALPAAPAGGGGYSLSAHVKRYYQTTMV